MRVRNALPAILCFACVPLFAASSIVDVSREWQAHQSTAPAAAISSTTVRVSTAPAAPKPEADASCGCETLTTPEKLGKSTYAFTGRVEEVTAPKKGRRTILFDVDEIFKGSPKLEMSIVMEVAGSDCDLVFEEGKSYLVYAQWQWGSAVTSRCMGSKLIEKARGDATALGPSEAMKEKLYIQLHNACMGRLDTSCCLASLKAMRQGYYVPEPDHGCPGGMIPDRLRCGGSYTWCIPISEGGHRQVAP